MVLSEVQKDILFKIQNKQSNFNELNSLSNKIKIISASGDNTLSILDLYGNTTQVLTGHTAHVNVAALCVDGKFVVSGSDDKSIKKWDLNTGECLDTIQGFNHAITSLFILTNDLEKQVKANLRSDIQCGFADGTIKVFRYTREGIDKEPVLSIKKHSDAVTVIYCDKNGNFWTASKDSVVYKWTKDFTRTEFKIDLKYQSSQNLIDKLLGISREIYIKPIISLSVDRKSNTLFIGLNDSQILIYDLVLKRIILKLRENDNKQKARGILVNTIQNFEKLNIFKKEIK